MKTRLIIWTLCSCFSLVLTGQDTQLYGTIPMILFKKGVNNQLDYTLALSSEMNAIDKKSGENRYTAKVLNLNVETALSYDLNPNLNLAGGFLFRLRDPFNRTNTELRPWQQLTIIHRLEQYRTRQRLRIEERWTGSTLDFDLRLRYRVSMDFPLEGERLDNKEFYLNLSTEALVTPTSERAFFFWESRTYFGLGYQFNERQRLEPALEFRTRKINEAGRRRHFLFFRLVWVAEIGA